jgi:SAM-dependent methyltransferase
MNEAETVIDPTPMIEPTADRYAALAGMYDLVVKPFAAAADTAIRAAAATMRPDDGPVLDIGAGTGRPALVLLDLLPAASVLAVEPSPGMRSVLLAKLAARPDLHSRVTVVPRDLGALRLPDRLGGALALGVIGHFDAVARRRLLADVAARLGPGAPLLLDLQPPWDPQDVPPARYARVDVGALTYECWGEARVVRGDLLRWTMRYVTLDGEQIVEERHAVYDYHHPSRETLSGEAQAAGLTVTVLVEAGPEDLRAASGDQPDGSSPRPASRPRSRPVRAIVVS